MKQIIKTLVSNPEKIIYPRNNLTKMDIIKYYEKIYPFIKPHIKDRNLVLRRFPNGIDSKDFYQRNAPCYFPESTVHSGGLKVSSIDELKFFLNLSSVEQYVGLNKLNSEYPDRLIIDIDPPKGKDILSVKAAKDTKKILDNLGLSSQLLYTGSKGFHIIVPIKPNLSYDEVRSKSEYICKLIKALDEDNYTMNPRLHDRSDKVYLDYTRNSKGQVTIAPYSLRSNDYVNIAVPLDWLELTPTVLNKWNYYNIDKRLKSNPFPWKSIKVNDLNKLKDKEFSFFTNQPELMHASIITHSANPLKTKFDEKFRPCYTPIEMLKMGVFGGSYFRDSNLIGDTPKVIFQLDKKLWGMPDPDPTMNYYKVLAGMDLDFWNAKNLIHPDDPAGWFQWYIKYYYGRRHADDHRQIMRWRSFVARHGAQAYGRMGHERQRQALLQWAWNNDLDSREVLNTYKLI